MKKSFYEKFAGRQQYMDINENQANRSQGKTKQSNRRKSSDDHN
jgi:hypothetical protein